MSAGSSAADGRTGVGETSLELRKADMGAATEILRKAAD